MMESNHKNSENDEKPNTKGQSYWVSLKESVRLSNNYDEIQNKSLDWKSVKEKNKRQRHSQ